MEFKCFSCGGFVPLPPSFIPIKFVDGRCMVVEMKRCSKCRSFYLVGEQLEKMDWGESKSKETPNEKTFFAKKPRKKFFKNPPEEKGNV